MGLFGDPNLGKSQRQRPSLRRGILRRGADRRPHIQPLVQYGQGILYGPAGRLRKPKRLHENERKLDQIESERVRPLLASSTCPIFLVLFDISFHFKLCTLNGIRSVCDI